MSWHNLIMSQKWVDLQWALFLSQTDMTWNQKLPGRLENQFHLTQKQKGMLWKMVHHSLVYRWVEVNGLKYAQHKHGPFEVWCLSVVGISSNVVSCHVCISECICCMFVCERMRLHLPFVHFMSWCWMPDANSPLSLLPQPESVFITSSLWTVKNRKCFSSSHLHTHTQTHTHYLCHSLPLSASLCLFFYPSLVASHILSGYPGRLKEFIRVCFILVLNIFSGLLHYYFCVKAWEPK